MLHTVQHGELNLKELCNSIEPPRIIQVTELQNRVFRVKLVQLFGTKRVCHFVELCLPLVLCKSLKIIHLEGSRFEPIEWLLRWC